MRDHVPGHPAGHRGRRLPVADAVDAIGEGAGHPAWRSDGSHALGSVGQHPVELRVALLDADLHAAAQPGVPTLERVAQGLGVQPGPAVAQVLEPQGLQRHLLRHALPGEGLHDGVLADPVEAAAEAEVLAVAAGDVAPAAAVADVPDVDLRVHPVRPDPAGEQVGIQVGPHQLGRGGVEVAGDPDDRQPLVGADGGLGVWSWWS